MELAFCLWAAAFAVYIVLKRSKGKKDWAVFIESADELIKRYEVLGFYNESCEKIRGYERKRLLECAAYAEKSNINYKIKDALLLEGKRIKKDSAFKYSCRIAEIQNERGFAKKTAVYSGNKILGYISFIPVIDEEKRKKLKMLKRYGVEIYMADGGGKGFAVNTAKRTGIIKDGDLCITGEEIELLDGRGIKNALEICVLFVCCNFKNINSLKNALGADKCVMRLEDIDSTRAFFKNAVSEVYNFAFLLNVSFAAAFLSGCILKYSF